MRRFLCRIPFFSLAILFAIGCFASDFSARRPPWDAINLVSFDRGDASDLSWQLQTPTVGAAATFPAGYQTLDLAGSGSTSVITYPDNDATESAPLTVCAWIRIDAYTSYRAIASDVSMATTYEGWHFYYGQGLGRGLAFGQADSSVYPVLTNYKEVYTASGDLTAGTWYHVAATLDSLGATPILYVNGVAKSTTVVGAGSIASLANADPLRIGGLGGQDFTSYHDGGIDDVRIYSTVKTAAEIAAIYAEVLGVSRP